MTILPREREAIGLRELLEAAIREVKQQSNRDNAEGDVLVSLTQPLNFPLSISTSLDLFDAGAALTADRFLWSQPGEAFTLAGFGIAYAVEAVEEPRFRQVGASWRRLLNGAILEGLCGLPGTGPLLMGGFAFDPKRSHESAWAGYPQARMILPKMSIAFVQGESWITINTMVNANTDPEQEADALAAFRDDLLNPDRLLTRDYSRTKLDIHISDGTPPESWKAQVARTAADIAHGGAHGATHAHPGKLDKVVLARPLFVEASADLDVGHALQKLSETYADCTIFAVAHRDAQGDSCFLGATPERLAFLHNGQLRTMSLAGSIRRGQTDEEDIALGTALLSSLKDRNEHRIVVEALTECLADICAKIEVEADSPSLLKLGNVQHLCTPISGWLKDGYTLLDVIERLHPTPAVGGRPREAALELIREREGFDRGWYTAPVGWLNADGEGDFAVALRCALVYGNQAILFAGCGIVANSDPEREYAEWRLKLTPMLAALSGD